MLCIASSIKCSKATMFHFPPHFMRVRSQKWEEETWQSFFFFFLSLSKIDFCGELVIMCVFTLFSYEPGD